MAKSRRWGAGTLTACLILAVAGTAWTALARAGKLDDTARVIAGIPAGPEKSAYAQEVSGVWSAYEKRIGTPMRQWGCKELPRTTGAVFYPFSGPDFPAVFQLFPDAGRYVLVATQRGEPPPSLELLSRSELEEYLAAFRRAWKFYGGLGFFRSEDLNADKAEGRPIGVTGALMAFAARLGFEIEAVEPIQIDVEGHQTILDEGAPETPNTWDSVRLTLRKGGRPVFLDYVLMNLADDSLGKVPGLRKWVERVAANPVLLKAASHHPQEPDFSIFRRIVLENATMIVQDETGIDYADLAGRFDVRLYGGFTRPNTAFDQSLQRSLAEAYRSTAGVRPLTFRSGYEKDSGAALQVAVGAPGTYSAPRACR